MWVSYCLKSQWVSTSWKIQKYLKAFQSTPRNAHNKMNINCSDLAKVPEDFFFLLFFLSTWRTTNFIAFSSSLVQFCMFYVCRRARMLQRASFHVGYIVNDLTSIRTDLFSKLFFALQLFIFKRRFLLIKFFAFKISCKNNEEKNGANCSRKF